MLHFKVNAVELFLVNGVMVAKFLNRVVEGKLYMEENTLKDFKDNRTRKKVTFREVIKSGELVGAKSRFDMGSRSVR